MNYSIFYRIYTFRITALPYILIILTAVAAFEQKASAQVTNASPDKTRTFDRSRLETIEELSESLANDLLELSVATRDRNMEGTFEVIPARLMAKAFPSRPKPARKESNES